jgi:hypothetical protein
MRKTQVVEAMEAAGLDVTAGNVLVTGRRGAVYVQAAPWGRRGEWRLQNAQHRPDRVGVFGKPEQVQEFCEREVGPSRKVPESSLHPYERSGFSGLETVGSIMEHWPLDGVRWAS